MNWTFWTRTPPTLPDDCETIDPLLSLYADGMVSPEEAGRVEAHLSGCAACRESLAWTRATRFALASRPVALPPADLRARIAEAIAASSDAPVPATFTTRRAFALRPALAAAASFVMLGFLSYGLLHHPPSAAVHPAPPQFAAVPPADTSGPVLKMAPGPGVKTHVVRRPSAAPKMTRLDPDRVALSHPEEAVPAPPVVKKHPQVKTDTRMLADATPASVRPQPRVAKKPTLRTPHPELMATTMRPAPAAETHKAPVLKPEPKSVDAVVAEAPHTRTPFVPTLIEKPPIITQDPVPTVAVASNGGGRLQTAEGHGIIKLNFAMQTFAHQTLSRVDSGSNKTGYMPLVSTP